MNLKADKKEKGLSWSTTASGTKIAYFRQQLNGKEKWQSLGELSINDAREKVRYLRKLHALNLLNEKLGLISKRSSVCSFEELFKAYDTYCKGIKIDKRTVTNNKGCASLILRRVKGQNFDVHKAHVSLFNTQLLRDFSAKSVAERKRVCEEKKLPEEQTRKKMDSVQRTIKSTVQQARSLFAKEALCSTAYSKLTLPNMEDVMKLSIGTTTVVPYQAPSSQVINRIARDAATLKETNPKLWLAFNLEVNAGLRRGSARNARWDWFVDHGKDPKGERWIDLRVSVAKGGESIVRFDATLFDEMAALKKSAKVYGTQIMEKKGPEFILPGDTSAERDAICKALVPWLRERGLDKRQPNHELRKLYGDRKYSEHGAEEAQRALGHSDSKLTSKVYASARARKSLRVF